MKARTSEVRRTSPRGDATRDRILDAAEELFAHHNFEAVSMRDIAQASSAELGTLVHHFRTKENLFAAVLARRAPYSAEVMRQNLQAEIDKRGPQLTTEDVLGAYARRIFQVAYGGREGDKHFLRIILQRQRIPIEHGYLHPALAESYQPVRELYLKTLHALCPQVAPAALESFFSVFEMSFNSAIFNPMQPVLKGRQAISARQQERNLVRMFVAGLAALAQPE